MPCRAVTQSMLEAWHLMSVRCSAITRRHFANGLQPAKSNFLNVYSCIKVVCKCPWQSVYLVASCLKVTTFILMLIILSLQEVQVLESHLQQTALVKLPAKDWPPRTASHQETRWLTAGRISQCWWMGLSHICAAVSHHTNEFLPLLHFLNQQSSFQENSFAIKFLNMAQNKSYSFYFRAKETVMWKMKYE